MSKLRWYWKVLLFYLVFFAYATIALSTGDYLQSVNNLFSLFFTGNTHSGSETLSGIEGIVVIIGLISQFFVIGFMVSLFLRFFISRQPDISRLIKGIPIDLPFRQILVMLFLTITITSTIVFKFVEDQSWLNSIYFTFATITTVGYGDVVATHPITKVVAIILIINGISFIGISSQFLVDRIIKLQIQTRDNVPHEPLSWENHIIVGGYGSKGRKLVQLFLERQYRVIVVDKDQTRIKPTSTDNLTIIQADITKSALLKLLSLKKAAGLFLLLSDDNQTIQTGIIARSISPDLDIFAEMNTNPTYEIARYAGINRPISQFHFLVNVINANVAHQDKYIHGNISDLKAYEGQLGFLIVPKSFDHSELFREVINIGYVNLLLNELSLSYDPYLMSRIDELEQMRLTSAGRGSHMLLAVDKEELFDKKKMEQFVIKPIGRKRVIFAGFPDFADEFLNRLGIRPENTIFLWQKETERELLETKEYTHFEWTMENGITLLDRIVQQEDLVICTFENITSSMLLGITLRKLDRQTHLIQLAPYDFDIEPLIQVGADAVVTPQRIISEAMINSFAKSNSLPPSIIFINGHVFEHLVYKNDFFHMRKVSELYKRGLKILFINRVEDSQFIETMPNDRLRENDRIVVYVSS